MRTLDCTIKGPEGEPSGRGQRALEPGGVSLPAWRGWRVSNANVGELSLPRPTASADTPYEAGVFKLLCEIPDDYPFVPPKLK